MTPAYLAPLLLKRFIFRFCLDSELPLLSEASILAYIRSRLSIARCLATSLVAILSSSFSVEALAQNINAGNNSPTSSFIRLADEGVMPPLSGATQWLNSLPLTSESLRGKVVLVEFWTYSCINCRRTLPYVKAWSEKYGKQGLVVIGVHTPEFPFEGELGNVQKAVRDLGIKHPVVLDNDYTIWRAFRNRYWPAHYFIDSRGRIRFHHFGEGAYIESEQVIQQLLREADIKNATVPVGGHGNNG